MFIQILGNEREARKGGTEKRTRGGRRNAQGGTKKRTRGGGGETHKGGMEKRTRLGRRNAQFLGQTHKGSYRRVAQLKS